MNVDKDKLILELIQKNKDLVEENNGLYEVIDGWHDNYEQICEIMKNKDRQFDELIAIAEQAISKPTKSIDQQLNGIINDYWSHCLYAKAKVEKDKRATFHLLKDIKRFIENGRPITGAHANYLVSAIDQILTDLKQTDVKGAFLLNGTMSLSGRDLKVFRAVEEAIADGHGKHKTKGKKKDGAYLKVANDLRMSPSMVETIYKGYSKAPDNEEFKGIVNHQAEKVAEKLEALIADRHRDFIAGQREALIENQPGLASVSILDKVKAKFLK